MAFVDRIHCIPNKRMARSRVRQHAYYKYKTLVINFLLYWDVRYAKLIFPFCTTQGIQVLFLPLCHALLTYTCFSAICDY